MVNNKQTLQLDLVFHALADGTRREILNRVAEDECTITELAEPFKMTLAAVSKHIKVLEKAGLLRRTKDGRIHRCRMDASPLEPALDVINHYKRFWNGQMDALEKYLNEAATEPKKKKRE
jgi:DNA-binding transcriptional ArsR family regulator